MTTNRIAYTFPARVPQEIAESIDPEVRRLLAVHERYIGQPWVSEYGDREEWLENAYRLDAALVAFGTDTWVVVQQRGALTIMRASDGATLGEADLRALIDSGTAVQFGPREGGHDFSFSLRRDESAAEIAAERYYLNPAWSAVSRRRTVVTTLGLDYGGSAEHVIADRARDADARVFVKVNQTKSWPNITLTVPRGTTPEAVHNLLGEELEWGVVTLDGMPDMIQVQDAITMRYEYRLFVVDGCVVTGAGCIEEFTPLERSPRSTRFDTRVREHRMVGRSDVIDAPEIVERLVAFGRDAARQLIDADPRLSDFVIDVALGADDAPLVVELNGLMNAGLYASDPEQVTLAIVAR